MTFFYALSIPHVTFATQLAYSLKTDFMKHFLLLLFFLPMFAQSQVNEGLTAEERAYLFHVVRKSPIWRITSEGILIIEDQTFVLQTKTSITIQLN